MPLIEELPVATTQRTSQGWAYVPDIKPQLQPLDRKRGAARNHAANKGEISAKQLKAIQTKLNELDKENYKDTTIPIPAKSKERAGKKITPNVRRILTYQRTFAHYLADEEAQLAQNGNSAITQTLPQTPTLARSGTSRGSRLKQTPMQPPPRPASARRTPGASSATTPAATPKHECSTSASIFIPSAAQPMDLDSSTTPHEQPTTTTQDTLPQTVRPSFPDQTNPLLRSKPHLKPPSAHVLKLLLSEPPLPYSAARAQALEDNPNNNVSRLPPKPTRHFCSICGYWGKIRCMRCGERTCGLMDCWNSHDGVCSVPAY